MGDPGDLVFFTASDGSMRRSGSDGPWPEHIHVSVEFVQALNLLNGDGSTLRFHVGGEVVLYAAELNVRHLWYEADLMEVIT